MTLSIIELSKSLGVAPVTIERWVKQGKLMAYHKGDENLKFRTKDVEKWAARQNIRLNIPDRDKEQPAPVVSLARAVRNGGVYYGIQGQDKTAVLQACVDKVTGIPEDFKQDLLDRLLDRENALSTGIGNGIAIPHPRDPLGYLAEPMVLVCFPESPIEYQALDHQPVFVLFIILSNALKTHLPLLSSLSLCLKNQNFSLFLTSQPDLETLAGRIQTLLTP